MKAADIRKKDVKELSSLLIDLRKSMLSHRIRFANGETNTLAPVRNIKLDIARIKTIMSEKDRGSISNA